MQVNGRLKVETRSAYHALFPAWKREKALEMALDTRKFEIELYWKRAAYFWAFIALAFAAFFMVYKESDLKTNMPDFYNEALLGISVFGLFLSFCWFLVNKGAKYWQENWERHVDLLEDSVMGPLYKLTLEDERGLAKRLRPLESGRFSVGKVNLCLSFSMVVVWALIAIERGLNMAGIQVPVYMVVIVIVLVGILFIASLFLKCGTTDSNGSKKFCMKMRVME